MAGPTRARRTPTAARAVAGLAAAALLLAAAPAGAARDPGLRSAHADGTFNAAATLPGTATLNGGATGGVSAMACPAPGRCTAAGYYTDVQGNQQAFVADQVNGTWQKAKAIPGLVAVNVGDTPGAGDAEVEALVCPSPGNCVVAGEYRDLSSDYEVFAAVESNGTWGSVADVPGLRYSNGVGLNVQGAARVQSLSCSSVGNCSAGGSYTDAAGNFQAWVASMSAGSWSDAIEVPNTDTLDTGGYAALTSLSCATQSSCTAVGYYTDSSNAIQAFSASRTAGEWGDAADLPGLATLNEGAAAEALTVACPSALECVTGGFYTDVNKAQQAFVAVETSGTWADAVELNGTDTLNEGGSALVSALACPQVGSCLAVGSYTDVTPHQQAMVDVMDAGTWQAAQAASASVALNAGGAAALTSVSCSSVELCVASGTYTDGNAHLAPLLDQAIGLAWQTSQPAPGVAKLNVAGGDASLTDVACAPVVAVCVAGGFYTSGPTATQPMVVSYTPPPSSVPTDAARTSIAALGGAIWTIDAKHAHVIEQRETDGAVLRTISVPGAAEAVGDGAHLWVTSKTTSMVYELTPSGAVLRRVKVPTGPTTLAASGGRVVVCSPAAQRVSVITATNGKVVSFPVAHPLDVAISGSGAWVLAAPNRLYDLAITTGKLLRTVTLPTTPTRLSASGPTLYVTEGAKGWLSIVSAGSGAVRTVHTAGAGAYQAVVAGGFLWVSNTKTSRLTVLTTAAGTAVKTVSPVPTPTEMVADGSFLWSVSTTAHLVTRVSLIR